MESESNFEMDIQEVLLSANFINIVVEDVSGEVESGRDKSRDEVNLNVANEDDHQKNKIEIERDQLGSKEINFESFMLNQGKEGDENLRNANEMDDFIHFVVVIATISSEKVDKVW